MASTSAPTLAPSHEHAPVKSQGAHTEEGERWTVWAQHLVTEVERNAGVTVLWASVGGSRAQQLQHARSDGDVKLLFCRPLREYLRCAARPAFTLECTPCAACAALALPLFPPRDDPRAHSLSEVPPWASDRAALAGEAENALALATAPAISRVSTNAAASTTTGTGASASCACARAACRVWRALQQLDATTYDLPHALDLLQRGNPTLLDMLRTPTLHRADTCAPPTSPCAVASPAATSASVQRAQQLLLAEHREALLKAAGGTQHRFARYLLSNARSQDKLHLGGWTGRRLAAQSAAARLRNQELRKRQRRSKTRLPQEEALTQFSCAEADLLLERAAARPLPQFAVLCKRYLYVVYPLLRLEVMRMRDGTSAQHTEPFPEISIDQLLAALRALQALLADPSVSVYEYAQLERLIALKRNDVDDTPADLDVGAVYVMCERLMASGERFCRQLEAAEQLAHRTATTPTGSVPATEDAQAADEEESLHDRLCHRILTCSSHE
jgi:hypothetical protein